LLNCYIYIRFSTPRQEQGDSKERQLTDCLAFAERQGWKVVEVIEDLGLSAWKGDHLNGGDLGKFADKVRSGEIPSGSVLLCEKLDRLSRLEPRKTQRWMEDLTEIGLSISTVDGGRVYNDANMRDNLMNIFEILMTAKLANDYSNNLSDRVGKAWKRKMENGGTKLITRKVPGWMAVAKDATMASEIKLIDAEVAKLITIYTMAANGLGVRAIARKMNDLGVKSIGRKGTWDQSVVRHLLVSPAVGGDYLSGSSNPNVKNKGVSILGYYPEAVPVGLILNARDKMNGRKLTGGRESSKAVNLFSGLIRCEECMSRMYLRSTVNNGRVYQCSNANQRRGCSSNGLFKHAPFEASALDEVLKVALDERFFQRPASSLMMVNQIAGTKKTLSIKEGEIKNVSAAIRSMGADPALMAELTVLRGEVEALTADLERMEGDLSKARGWASPADHAKRVLEIRDAINDPDKETRETARLKVMDALKGVITEIVCDQNDTYRGAPERTFTVIMVGGASAVKIANDGEIIAKVDVSDRGEDYRNAATGVSPNIASTANEGREKEFDAFTRRKSVEA